MSDNSLPPDFNHFARWIAAQSRPRAASTDRYSTLLSAARGARDEFLRTTSMANSTSAVGEERSQSTLEVLYLLAAASTDNAARPPELTTARGFRVTLAYDEGETPEQSSICVLVQSPPDMLRYVQNATAYLWNGTQRFELGQFDIDGKAIGNLPAGVHISISDFASGKVKLEEPGYPTQD
jgi:hypothetical protein